MNSDSNSKSAQFAEAGRFIIKLVGFLKKRPVSLTYISRYKTC